MADAAELAELRTERWYRNLLLAVLKFTLHAVWTIVILSAAVGKLINHGFFNYVRHYTNWSWTLQLLFFAATLAAPFIQHGFISHKSALGSFTQTVLVLGFFPLFGVVTTVMALVNVLLGSMSDFITDIFAVMPAQIVIIGNDLFHNWPFTNMLIFAFAYHRLLYHSLNRVAAHFGVAYDALRLTLWFAYEGFFGTILSLLLYALLFDPRQVYETDIPFETGGALAAFLVLFSSGFFFLVTAALVGVVSKRAYPDNWLANPDTDPTLVGRVVDPESQKQVRKAE